MPKLVNRAKMTTATTGTGTITLGSAVDGYQTFANAGVANSNIVRYAIEDGSAWEIGLGTYSSTGTTLTRGTIESSTGTAINLSGNATVFVTAAAGDLQELVTFAETFALPTVDGTNGQVLTTNGSGTLTFTTISGYTNADVDTHLNTGTATTGEVLSWNGSDYDWIAVSGGATDINGLSDGYSDGSSVGLGSGALANDDGTSNQNVAVGVNAGNSLSTASRATLIGFEAGRYNTGNFSTAVGNAALSSGSGASNTAMGYSAGGSSLTTGTLNSLFGASAGTSLSTGSYNSIFGAGAASQSSTMTYLTAIGYQSAEYVNGTRNIAIGQQGLRGNSVSFLTGSDNIGIGHQTGYDLSTGSYNFLGGYLAGTNLTTGSNNVAIGNGALDAATTGGQNIAIGQDAMGAGVATAASGYNVAISRSALQALTTGTSNIAIGLNAMLSATTASSNVVLGSSAGRALTTGTQNVILGESAAFGTPLTTGSNNIVIGRTAGPSATDISNEITLGNSSITTLRCQVTTITSLSDARDKTDIQPLTAGLEFVEALNPVSFSWNMRDGGKVGVADTGFIAQDLQMAQEWAGVTIPGLVYDVNPDKLEAGYGKLIPVLVQAIKDLSAKVNLLEAQLEAQK